MDFLTQNVFSAHSRTLGASHLDPISYLCRQTYGIARCAEDQLRAVTLEADHQAFICGRFLDDKTSEGACRKLVLLLISRPRLDVVWECGC